MAFWLATLNPARRKKARKGRRRLSAWQRAVKRHGGVMQAVRARRRGHRGGRNPFLTSTGLATEAFAAANVRRRRKHSKRRSAGSRGRPRGRHGANAGRSAAMAKVKGRRRRSRRRNAWFDARRAHARAARLGWRRRRGGRRRRNAVVPVSWNPVFRTKRGRYSRRGPGRRLHLVPGGGWRNPAGRRRRRRSNAVLPFTLMNPAGLLSMRGDSPIGAVMSRAQSLINVDFWTQTGLPAAGGFFGSKALGGTVYGLVGEKLLGLKAGDKTGPFVRIGCDAIAGAGLAWAVGRFYSRKAGDAVWLGTVVNVAYALLKQLLGGTEIAKTIGLEGLGEDLSERMKTAVARRVEEALSGLGVYPTDIDLRRQVLGEYATDEGFRRSPAYAPGPAADLRDYDVSNTELAL